MVLSETKFKELCFKKWSSMVSEDDYQVASVIKDVIHMKEGYYPKFFSDDDCKFLIYSMSTQ